MNIADGLSRQAATTPFAVAVVREGLLLHYRTFDQAVWRAATFLRKQGIGPGDVVGVSCIGQVAHLLVAFALARMGAVQVALPLHEPSAARRDRAAFFGAVAVIGDNPAAGEAGVPVVRFDTAWLAPDGGPGNYDVRSGEDDQPWLIGHSSGTTGAPKAFSLTHRDAVARAARETAMTAIRSSDVFLSPMRLDFPANKLHAFNCLAAGATFATGRLDAEGALVRLAEMHRATYLNLTASSLAGLLQACSEDGVRLPYVRVLRAGAGTIGEELRRAALQRLSPNLVVTYGTNEGGLIATAEPPALARRIGAAGRAVAGIRWEIVDEADRLLPPGSIGAIRLAGPGVARGYWQAEADARHFRDGWFHPGDLVSCDADGLLAFHGRVDDLMNFDGIKIYPADIEDLLLTHPAVAEAAAFPTRPAPGWDLPMAAVVLREQASEDELLAHCRARLGMRAPRRVMIEPRMPRNNIGKVLKRELAARLEAMADT
ncbi:class I adenylate-forming enzyme family protein [Marinimicrococcus flavescens]|uniref:Class I adenylate-forming enzyme family protein n=1 Tax=Marinimicrococcus flavescens TaxID=3031815 RepID=A0AAP3XRD8_9PROT|nr:class I adenylate-forming enzyme family protein [Marinimicrococcus flavescens]